MATDTPMIRDGNTVAEADLSAKQFLAVSISGVNEVNLAAGAGAIFGILQNKPKAGEAADVAIFGITKAIAGVGGWSAGDKLEVEVATSKLVNNTTGNTTVALALTDAVAGDIATVYVIPNAG